MKLTGFQLAIQHPEKTVAFYTQVLGMSLNHTEKNDNRVIYTLGFAKDEPQLQLLYDSNQTLSPYALHPQDNYWKYSIFVEDIQAVYQRLTAQNHPIGEPYQFGDIGYLAHTVDTENHQIEFIQKTFKNSSLTSPTTDKNPVLGLLTLRTIDPMQSIRQFEEVLAMKLHVRMHVERGGGFSLYFLGDKQLTPPSSDIDALENREWLYQQRHLFIELQHYWGSDHATDFSLNSDNNALQQLNFTGDLSGVGTRLNRHLTAFEQTTEATSEQIHFESTDKHRVVVSKP